MMSPLMHHHLAIRFSPDEQFLAPIRRGLRASNEARIGAHAPETFAIHARDAEGTLLGGSYGFLVFGWLHLEWLWVDEGHRGKGLGSALLGRMEELARERGVRHARLDTVSFQGALGLYRRCGYEVYAELPLFTQGTAEPTERAYYLRKQL